FKADTVGGHTTLTAVARAGCNQLITTDSVVWSAGNAKATVTATDSRHATVIAVDTGVVYVFGTIAGIKDSTRFEIDTVLPAPPPPTLRAVGVTPSPVTLDTGAVQAFTAVDTLT